MTGDLVERLRRVRLYHRPEREPAYVSEPNEALVHLAADEIERLRAALAEREAEVAGLREAAEEATDILVNLSANIKAKGHYSVESTVTFLGGAVSALAQPPVAETGGIAGIDERLAEAKAAIQAQPPAIRRELAAWFAETGGEA